MKKITLFYLERCPHCKRARGFMQELYEENPEYKKIPIKMVEESVEAELANSFDYYYVPCFYIEDEKINEGTIGKEEVKSIFDKALNA